MRGRRASQEVPPHFRRHHPSLPAGAVQAEGPVLLTPQVDRLGSPKVQQGVTPQRALAARPHWLEQGVQGKQERRGLSSFGPESTAPPF